MDDVLVSFLDDNSDKQFIYMQDNASIHVSKQSRAYFSERNIPLLEWPACSPDCNPIENLWGILASRVYANGRQFESIQELKQCIQTYWSAIDQSLIDKLVDSMENRIFEVIKNQGNSIKY